jgi:hypothetical protein
MRDNSADSSYEHREDREEGENDSDGGGYKGNKESREAISRKIVEKDDMETSESDGNGIEGHDSDQSSQNIDEYSHSHDDDGEDHDDIPENGSIKVNSLLISKIIAVLSFSAKWNGYSEAV